MTPGDPVLIGQVSVELRGAAADDKAFQELFREAPLRRGQCFQPWRLRTLQDPGTHARPGTRLFRCPLQPEPGQGQWVSDQADIFLHYDSGQRFRFGAIDYSHTDLEPGLLTALQPIHAGDYFDQSRLQYFQAQLQRTGYFAGVVIKPLFDQVTDYRVPLSVTLHPAQSHGFDVGLGYSTDTQERVSMVWRTPA